MSMYVFGASIGAGADLIIQTLFGKIKVNILSINGHIPNVRQATQLWQTFTYENVVAFIDVKGEDFTSYVEGNFRGGACLDFVLKKKPTMTDDFTVVLDLDFSELQDTQLWIQTQSISVNAPENFIDTVRYPVSYNRGDKPNGYAVGNPNDKFTVKNKLETDHNTDDSKGRKIRFTRTNAFAGEKAYFAIADTKVTGTQLEPTSIIDIHHHPKKVLENMEGKNIMTIIVPKAVLESLTYPAIIRQGFHREKDSEVQS